MDNSIGARPGLAPAALWITLMHRIATLVLLTMFLVVCGSSTAGSVTPRESICHGSTSRGWIEHAVRLPLWGTNFQTYSTVGAAAGRTHVHSRVSTSVLDAYAALASSHPDLQFVYGETGWPRGGRIRPHRTHQNGLSVDFFVPVRDAKGKPVRLPTPAHSGFGYAMEFDEHGRLGDLSIDFEALALHLLALDHAARRAGAPMDRVILDAPLRKRVLETKLGAEVSRRIRFLEGMVWIRHDEHYHVDFSVKCAR